MTDKEALLEALEALHYCEALNRDVDERKMQAITVVRKLWAQPEQEPVAWIKTVDQLPEHGQRALAQDEIIEMAQECRLIGMRPHLDGIYSEALVAFAKLVAEKEREACAKICEDLHPGLATLVAAKHIRARGQA
jgi:hypothetical protein